MSADSKIAWTHHTFNPWWGCVKVSQECTNCYAESIAKMYGHSVWGAAAPRRFFGDKHWREPLKWNAAASRAGERHRVFCASMADVFEDRDELLAPHRDRLWAVIEATPMLDWLLLTKRPERWRECTPERWWAGWPSNIWFGTTIGHPDSRDRLGWLRDAPAAVRFISAEPLLAPLSFWEDSEIGPLNMLAGIEPGEVSEVGSPKIDWLILGGESGPKARECQVDWMRSLMAEAREAGTAIFVKQLGTRAFDLPKGSGGDDGVFERLRTADRAGADESEFPPDLRIREFPQSTNMEDEQ